RGGRISVSAVRCQDLCCVWKMGGKAYASPCTLPLPKNSGLLPSKPCPNRRKVSSAFTKARKFLPSGRPDSRHKKHGLRVSCGALRPFRDAAVRSLGFSKVGETLLEEGAACCAPTMKQ